LADAGDKTATLLAVLWVRIRPIVEERFATLDEAAAAAESGSLNAEVRGEGMSSAHKLAGSLGMYGFDEGTRIAREIEVLLGGANPDALHLSRLIAVLGAAVFPDA
jgi:chemotaxis protein histidine kinase CheA